MEQAKEENDLNLAFNAGLLYEKLGKGHIGVSKFMSVIEKAKGDGKKLAFTVTDYPHIRDFIKRNTGKRERKQSSNLEGRVSVFILFILGGLVLSLTSLTATGNAISNLTGTSQGLLGLIFFIIGLVGIFFHFRKS